MIGPGKSRHCHPWTERSLFMQWNWKLTSKAKLNCEIYKAFRKCWKSQVPFCNQSSPGDTKSLDVALILHQFKQYARKTCCCGQQWRPFDSSFEWKERYASINVTPERGGDPGHMWGIWPLLPSPPSGIWLKIWVPGWWRSLFLHGGMKPSHVVPCTLITVS